MLALLVQLDRCIASLLSSSLHLFSSTSFAKKKFVNITRQETCWSILLRNMWGEGTAAKDQKFGECDPIGEPVFVDQVTGFKFYRGVKVHNLRVKVGDLVRIILEADDDDDDSSFGFAQVLSIFETDDGYNAKRSNHLKSVDEDNGDEVEESEDEGEGMMAEVRWFLTPNDLAARRKKKLVCKIFPI